jgi:hypothetical protein
MMIRQDTSFLNGNDFIGPDEEIMLSVGSIALSSAALTGRLMSL